MRSWSRHEILAFAVPNKGMDEYAIQRGSTYVNKVFGYDKMVFKSDQEPAIISYLECVKSHAGNQIMCEHSPVGDSKSDGEIENAVQEIQGQFRSIKGDLESSYGNKVPPEHPSLPWLVTHAAMCVFRYKVGPDGRTAYHRLKGKRFDRNVVKFGECVFYLKLKSKGRFKADSRWGLGV